jgi:hypothetical protein
MQIEPASSFNNGIFDFEGVKDLPVILFCRREAAVPDEYREPSILVL